ncbi:MAG: hypothetical protein HLUCCA08_05470 [Rhodobacteraceae bacterium HLUCCA08]|nr:MAG: hypothetical protein HLUCCA08_05470 [Rhodobacteraceae bacterium HLUCCA08]
MTETPESTHDRLTRELARMQLRSVGFWGGWALLIGIVGLFALLTLPGRGVTFVQGKVTGVTPLTREDGINMQIGVDIDGQSRIARSPAQLVHPQIGETVCLRRIDVRGPLGRTTYDIAAPTLCGR